MIRFYVSWYPGDPIYPIHASDCSMLLSPTSVSDVWTVQRLSSLPARLIVDSGGYRYAASDDIPPTAATLLQRQIKIIANSRISTLLCALDTPLTLPQITPVQADQNIARTLAHAFEVHRLIQRRPLPSHCDLMAVVQGNDISTLRYCTRELKHMGYLNFGIGSLSRIFDTDEITARIEAVYSVVERPLHLFGIGSPNLLAHLPDQMIASVDSSRPAKAAACNEIFYSNPYRRYGIRRDGKPRANLSLERCLERSFPCICPVCQADTNAILEIGKRHHIRNRTLHNYFHLRAAIEGEFEI